ncbi:MAG TPA: lysophospholipid acyltransferase family protein [Chloroflexia bacterium]|nr:lysophospholipid acyltransferase family protein [Chloroflexia bacterium]
MVRLLIIVRWIVGRVPVGLGNWCADRLGDLAWLVAPRSSCAARSNMRHVLGPAAPERVVRRMARRVLRNMMRNYYDLFRIGRVSDAELDEMIDFDKDSLAMVQRMAATEHGILLVTAHWGAFDMVTQVLLRRGLSIMFLVARFRPPQVAEFITDLRRQRGSELVWIDDGLTTLKKAMQALRAGRLVGLMPDRNMDRTGIMIPFFGDDTVVATGLAKMALRSRAPIVPGFCYRVKKNRYAFFFTQPIYPPQEGNEADKVTALTRAVFAVFEQQIARYPDQWTLLQPIWPDAPCPPDPGLAPA